MANKIHLITGYAGKEHITSADQGSYNAGIWGNGSVVMERGNKIGIQVTSNNNVRILDGDIVMQGRHIRIEEDTYIDLPVDNGQTGYNRNDLVVCRYTKNAITAIEDVELLIIKGDATTGTPTDPAYTKADILTGNVLIADMPLYRLPIRGLNIETPTQLFTAVNTLETLKAQLIDTVNKAIEDMQKTVVDEYDTAMAVTKDNVAIGCKAFQAFVKSVNEETENLQDDINGLKTDKSNTLVVSEVSGQLKVDANGYQEIAIVAAKEGYTMLGVVGVATGQSYVHPYDMRAAGANVYIRVRNYSSSQKTGTVKADVLYVKK